MDNSLDCKPESLLSILSLDVTRDWAYTLRLTILIYKMENY